MEILHIKYFKAVADCESFTKAAELLHIGQPSLSKAVARIEEELGVQLFERVSSRVRLNHFGTRFLDYVNDSILALDNGIQNIRYLAEKENGHIYVANSEDILLKRPILDYLLAHPDVSLHNQLQSCEQMIESLRNGVMDFAVSTDPLFAKDIEWRPLMTDQLMVLVSAKHPLADRKRIQMQELAKETFAIGNMSYGMRSLTYNLCDRLGFSPNVIYEGDDKEMVGELVRAGLAINITSYTITHAITSMVAPDHKVRTIPVDVPNWKKVIGIAVKKGHFRSAAADDFMQNLEQYFQKMSLSLWGSTEQY